jgi:hypothetical protein
VARLEKGPGTGTGGARLATASTRRRPSDGEGRLVHDPDPAADLRYESKLATPSVAHPNVAGRGLRQRSATQAPVCAPNAWLEGAPTTLGVPRARATSERRSDCLLSRAPTRAPIRRSELTGSRSDRGVAAPRATRGRSGGRTERRARTPPPNVGFRLAASRTDQAPRQPRRSSVGARTRRSPDPRGMPAAVVVSATAWPASRAGGGARVSGCRCRS